MRTIRDLAHATRRIKELRAGLMYTGDSPFYLSPMSIRALQKMKATPVKEQRRRRVIEAYFALKGLHVVVSGLHTQPIDGRFAPAVAYEGVQYPFRPIDVPFDVYEVAVVLIRDGINIDDAFEMAPRLA